MSALPPNVVFRRGRWRQAETRLVRFEQKVSPEPTSGCWLWTGAMQPKGYGTVKVDGRVWLAHRAVYTAHVGPIPAGLDLDHKCRNRSCVRPDHLEPVTHAENLQRASKLSPASVAAMRAACDAGEARGVVASRYGIGAAALGAIIRGDRWSELKRLRLAAVECDGAEFESKPRAVGRPARATAAAPKTTRLARLEGAR